MRMSNDKDLIKKCIDGKRLAQETLYKRFAPAMLSICMRYSKSKLEAEDILQDAFIKIFKSLPNFRWESRLEYWIKRVVINTALNANRNKLYLFPMVDIEDISIRSDKDYSLQNFQYEELLEMVRELPSGCQIIFNLYAIEGYTHKEIAETLNVSEGTSKSQYSRAKSLLQVKLEKEKKISYGTLR